MSFILFSSVPGLPVVFKQCDTKTADIVHAYLQNILAKSNSSLASSHIQALNQDGISISLYYRSVKDETNTYIVCFICDGTALLSPFYHELDKYTDTLVEHLADPESYLLRWQFNCIEYVLRVVDYFKNDLSPLLYIALSRNNIEILASNPNSQIVRDTHLFISSCSLKELMYNTAVVFEPCTNPEENTVMIEFDNKIVNYESNKFCSKWASMIESEFDAYIVRQKLEDYKIAANEDLNTFRRLLHLAEADHYAFFQGYEFIKLHDNGKILFEMLSHESMVYSLENLENLLNILQKFRLYKESVTLNKSSITSS